MFLTPSELAQLTSYRQKAKQIAQLRRMGIPFFINAAGQPIVARAVVQGEKVETKKTWEPKWVAARQSIRT